MSGELESTEGRTESSEKITPEQQELNDATFESQSFVEQTGDFEQSERIQENLVNIVENEIQTEAESISATQPEIRGDVSQAELAGEKDGDALEATPINTPGPATTAEQNEATATDNLDSIPSTSEISATPITLPDKGSEVGLREGSTEAESISDNQPEIRGDVSQAELVGEKEGETLEATPINTPGPAIAVEIKEPTADDPIESIPSDSEVSATPITLPDKGSDVGTSPSDMDTESSNPIPLPNPAAESEISGIPLPLPGENRPEGETALPDLDTRSNNPIPLPNPAAESEISNIPLPLPGENRPEGETALPNLEAGSNDPIPMPNPATESEISDIPLPIPGENRPESETTRPDMDSKSNNPIPMPSPTAEMGGKDVGMNDALGDASSEVSEPLREANFQEPLLQQDQELQDTSQEGLQDLGNVMPGRGNVEGGPSDGFGNQEPGSDLMGMPGFEGGPDSLTNDPGGPELPPGGIPGGGEMEGCGYGGSAGRYQRAKEIANMGAEPLTFDPGWSGAPKNDSKGVQPGTASDYDEFEKDQKAFEKAKVDVLNEFQKQNEAKNKQKAAKTPKAKPKKAKPKKAKPKTTTPKKPKTPPKPKPKKSSPGPDGGGEYTGSSSPNMKYNPDLISMETADDQGDAPPDGVLPKYQEQVKKAIKESKHSGTRRAGAELITDPPESDQQKGKDAADKSG